MTQTLGDFLSGIFVGLGQDSAMGDKLATAAKGVYINNVVGLTPSPFLGQRRRHSRRRQGLGRLFAALAVPA